MIANLANEPVEYKITEGAHFVTKSFVYTTGLSYTEVTSRASWMGWPLFHMTMGRCPETGRRKVAKGWIAIGRFAFGGLAIGQLAAGIIALSQLGFGFLFLLGQAGAAGYKGAGQVVLASSAAYGQIAVAGNEAVGQVAIAKYALGQVGIGEFVYDMERRDKEAEEHFAAILSLFPPPKPCSPATVSMVENPARQPR